MKNELGRKITSLTIMTIMIAGGMTFAAPGMMPSVAAENQLLFVSAENAAFGNTFGGGQIVEIIVQDPNSADTDVVEAEPTVEVNGDTVRMTQGTDGYWYAYIADTAGVLALDVASSGYDYGTKFTAVGDALGKTATATVNPATSGVTDTIQAADVAITNGGSNYDVAPIITFVNGGTCDSLPTGTANLTDGTVTSVTITGTGVDNCGAGGTLTFAAATNTVTLSASSTAYVAADVLGGEQSLGTVGDGQIGVEAVSWPFVQAFDFTVGGVEIVLEKAGADESVLLDYSSMEDFASIAVDRSSAPRGAEVHLTITDGQLNIDPTSEETITFNYSTGAVMSGEVGVDTNDISTKNGCDDNCTLLIDVDANGTAVLETDTTDDDGTADIWLVFTETSANSGVWSNTDDNDDASLDVTAAAIRGTTATIDYNDSAFSFSVSTSTGLLDMDESSVGDEWNSGESMTVTLTDEDLNLNSASDETISFSSVNIPTIVTGSPVSAYTGNDSRVLVATLASNLEPLTGITGTVINAMTGMEDRVAVNVSDCASATGWILTGSDGGELATNTASTNSVTTFSNTPTASEWVILNVIGAAASATCNVAVDFMSFGSGQNDAVYRLLLEETDDNTGVFSGDIEYIMLNQLNSDVAADIPEVTTNSDSITMVLAADHTGTDAPRIKYSDTDSDGQATDIADQADANTHNGVVSLDQVSYRIADTVTVTVDDMDLNADSSLIDVYTSADNVVGDDDNTDEANSLHILDIYLGTTIADLDGLGFTLVETDVSSGLFTGTFQIPSGADPGDDVDVTYIDWLDASGNKTEVGTTSVINATSGSVSLDRNVYPVPWVVGDFKEHDGTTNVAAGSITLTVQVTDADYNTSPTGEDKILGSDGVVKVEVSRSGYTTVSIASAFDLVETTADSGVFEYEFTQTGADVFAAPSASPLQQGDIITVTYDDPNDASGNIYTNTDSSTVDLRTGSLMSDKSVYLKGSDAIISIVDYDLNLDSGTVDSYPLGLVEWDSDASTQDLDYTDFDAEPSTFRETGEDTGIFQTVITIPETLASTALDSGEAIDLEYVDYGTSGENNYGAAYTEDIKLTIYTSNFGATIEMDKKVYTWTDRVFVTITAPDHNVEDALVDEIGGDTTLTVQTRSDKLTDYKLVETGPDTGIFWGEVTLAGYAHDHDGDGTNYTPVASANDAAGPTDGLLEATESDGITFSFEYSEDQTVVSSALVRWNIAEVAFGEDAYLANSNAIVTVSDIDRNMNNDAIENFTVEMWSDSDSGGVDLTVIETSEASGEFTGVVFFTTSDASSGHTLRVSEGDSITASYTDYTLPEPYTASDELEVTSVAVIGTIIPPLERAPAANLRTVDAFGSDVDVVSVDQQVQLQANISNGSDGEQPFAYLVQVQNDSGVTVSLAWITGTLSGGQSFSPALSWIPAESGSYTATAFVWESISNPTALSESISTTITVE